MTLDPQAQAVLDLLAELGLSDLFLRPVDEVRALTLEMSRQREGPEVASTADLTIPGPAGLIPARLYRPRGTAGNDVLPLLVWFHGGGWTIGSVESSDPAVRSLTNATGAAILSVDYRLGPEHPFPAAVEDCWAATQWAVANAAGLGADPARLVVGGDSAGANLTAVVCLLARDAGGPRIALQVLVYPATDARMLHPSIDENGEGYLLTKEAIAWFYGHYGLGATARPDDWRVSPLLAASHRDLPRAFVLTAGYDPLRDEGTAYANALAAAGVTVEHVHVPDQIHGFFTMVGQVDAAERAHETVGAALRAALG